MLRGGRGEVGSSVRIVQGRKREVQEKRQHLCKRYLVQGELSEILDLFP